MSKLSSSRGASLIQVLLAASALAALSLLGIRMAEDQQKIATSTAQNYEMAYIVKEVKLLLSDPASCRSSLGGKFAASSKQKISNLYREIPSAEGSNRLEAYPLSKENEFQYGQGDLALINFSLSDRSKEVSVSRNSTHLLIKFDKGKSSFGNSKFIKKVKLRVETDGDVIVDCQTFEKPTPTLWAQESELIRYKNGPVGVGKKAKHVKLSVAGAIGIADSSEAVCTSESKGLINKSESGFLRYCNGINWININYTELDFKNQHPYQLAITRSGASQHPHLEHRFCVLNKITKRGAGDCSLEKVGNTWLLKGELLRNRGKIVCEVNCYD
ncbi:MAG: hypothetical protein HN509_18450 [Halobacteriovoraceae bacterium]|jgi:hypothetical protein|nr:hypothetical protein [Halobacteriovoraceae bacterium]MBT5094095.1 hypothetical protein [Halobacteriovoraceae bacterium]